jgi:DNA polymerase-3 subunit beta
MKFNIQQTELNTALQHLVRNTDNKFFADIKITTIGSKLILQATNGEVSIEYRLEATTEDNDTILINARKFTDIVSRLSGDITFEDGVIKAGKSKLKIDLKRDEGYQFINTIEADTITLNIKELQTGIKNRLFACDTLSQNVLSGVCLNKDEIVTCNGNMLALYRLNEQLPFDTVILGNKLCQEILKCFNDEEVQVSMTNNKIMLKSDKITLVGSLLQGSYPNYKAIMPHPEYHATINKSLVINAIELLKLIDEKACTFTFNEDKLVISVGDSNTEVDVKYSGLDMSITFNSNYMINCLKNIDSEVVGFGFINNRTGVTLSTDKELTLLMPIAR